MIRMWINGMDVVFWQAMVAAIFWGHRRSILTTRLVLQNPLVIPPHQRINWLGEDGVIRRNSSHKTTELFNTSGCIGVFVFQKFKTPKNHGMKHPAKIPAKNDWSSSLDPRLMASWLASKLIHSMSGSLGANPCADVAADFWWCETEILSDSMCCFCAWLFLLLQGWFRWKRKLNSWCVVWNRCSRCFVAGID